MSSRRAASAFLVAAFAGMSAPVRAQTVPATPAVPAAPAATEKKYSINYKDNLLSVREDGGPYLFAQTVTSPTVTLRFASDGVHPDIKASLRATEKTLWTKTFSVNDTGGRPGRGSFQFNTDSDGGVKISLSRADSADNSADSKPREKTEFTATLRADNAFLVGDVRSGKDGAHLQRLDDGGGIAVTTIKDGKPGDAAVIRFDPASKSGLTAEVNGQEVASFHPDSADQAVTLSDEGGKVTFRTIKQNGKDYVEVMLGERRLLIEGVNFKATRKDGVMSVSVTPQTPAAPAASKP